MSKSKIVVSIEYDGIEPYWLNPDNVKLCLEAYCKNTKFEVKWANDGDPWEKQRRQNEMEKLLDKFGG